MSSTPRTMTDRRGRVYTPAVGPRLRLFLWPVLIGFALLGANGFYLASVKALSWYQGSTQQTFFYFMMELLHLALGFALIVPFLVFGLVHLATSWKRPNKEAIRYGLVLLACSVVILVSGLVLVQLDVIKVRDPRVRDISYWLHLGAPVVAIGLYVRHRLAGPRIRWQWARRFGGVVVAFVAAMAVLHSQDPRSFGVKGPTEGKQYFYPSSAITANGKFIPADVMMMDEYCLKCHKDAYDSWFHSAHHFSSFNNKAYLTSVRETRQVSLKRDGDTQAARWCAGCHDPVPFFSGEFDDKNYDDVNTRSSQAGITCTVCHSINNVNSTRGNADYTIEEPQHYPFATSDNAVLQWLNNTLVKAKPEMHKKTFLKPIIKDSKFCSTCHKVGLPFALNHYKDFLRGQNHYDTFLLSGVSGGGARSFNYPPAAKGQCVDCHMNYVASRDFGARDFDGKPGREIHNHLFVGANTGLATILGNEKVAKTHADFLRDKKVRIDIFALRDGGGVDDPLIAPLRPVSPVLEPKKSYLVETVVRTLAIGHPFSQGTVDSNEIWVELIARQGDRVIGRSGGIGKDGTVDPYSHFINVYMLDRFGKRIDRRNPQDIFVPLYNKQVPPGAGQVVHFGLVVPAGISGPITLEARVNYRKFDRKYLDYIFGKAKGPELPVTVMARDELELAIKGGPAATNKPSPIDPPWQRWNDYGIGLLLEGGEKGGQKGELKQAEHAFKQVVELGPADGWVNLARVYQKEGRISEALAALEKAAAHEKPAAPWVINWLTGQINERNAYFDEAIANYESVLSTRIPSRGFDFSGDYDVINALGRVLFNRAMSEPSESPLRAEFLAKSIAAYRRTIAIDSENVEAHHGLHLAYSNLAPDGGIRAAGEGTHSSGHAASSLTTLGQQVANPKRPGSRAGERRPACASRVESFLAGQRPPYESVLEPLHEVVETLGPAWESASASASHATPSARSWRSVTQNLHKQLKPDETAEGRAISTARKNSPAADQNAQSIVIHSLHRPGAPGIDSDVRSVTQHHSDSHIPSKDGDE